MKLLVVSDIHSNIWALEAILAQEPNMDRLCCAGDLVDYGTAPAEVLAWFAAHPDAVVVQGNHDAHTVNIWQEGEYNTIPPAQYKWVHHNCRRLGAGRIGYLDALPRHAALEADGWNYLVQHQYDDGYGQIETAAQFDDYWHTHAPVELRDADQRCLVFGHTHRRRLLELGDGMRCLNPGSCSYRRPEDRDKTAQYARIVDGQVTLCSVPYNRQPLLEEAQTLCAAKAMMPTELQDFFFFFGDAQTTRDPIRW